ncbi:MAG: GntR family transcriptional regulator [Candidatus Promineifilaceae bacterium]
MDSDYRQPMTQLDRSSKVPLYHQLYEILRVKIIDGQWPTGTMIPPESELCSIYQVSQITARQALDNLVSDGLIYRQRGRGSFVAQPAIETNLSRIVSFTEDMRSRGYEPGSRVFFSEVVAARPAIAKKLQVEPGEQLAQLNRLRFADGQPLSVERASLVHKYCPGVLAGNYESSSLRLALLAEYGLKLVRAEQSIRALSANKDLASLLSIRPGDPLLGIERVSFAQPNVPVEYLQIFYRADRYVLHVELQG